MDKQDQVQSSDIVDVDVANSRSSIASRTRSNHRSRSASSRLPQSSPFVEEASSSSSPANMFQTPNNTEIDNANVAPGNTTVLNTNSTGHQQHQLNSPSSSSNYQTDNPLLQVQFESQRRLPSSTTSTHHRSSVDNNVEMHTTLRRLEQALNLQQQQLQLFQADARQREIEAQQREQALLSRLAQLSSSPARNTSSSSARRRLPRTPSNSTGKQQHPSQQFQSTPRMNPPQQFMTTSEDAHDDDLQHLLADAEDHYLEDAPAKDYTFLDPNIPTNTGNTSFQIDERELESFDQQYVELNFKDIHVKPPTFTGKGHVTLSEWKSKIISILRLKNLHFALDNRVLHKLFEDGLLTYQKGIRMQTLVYEYLKSYLSGAAFQEFITGGTDGRCNPTTALERLEVRWGLGTKTRQIAALRKLYNLSRGSDTPEAFLFKLRSAIDNLLSTGNVRIDFQEILINLRIQLRKEEPYSTMIATFVMSESFTYEAFSSLCNEASAQMTILNMSSERKSSPHHKKSQQQVLYTSNNKNTNNNDRKSSNNKKFWKSNKEHCKLHPNAPHTNAECFTQHPHLRKSYHDKGKKGKGKGGNDRANTANDANDGETVNLQTHICHEVALSACQEEFKTMELIVDSGASSNYFSTVPDGTEIEAVSSNRTVTTANGGSSPITGKANFTLFFTDIDRNHIPIPIEALIVPSLTSNLLSLNQLRKSGIEARYSCFGDSPMLELNNPYVQIPLQMKGDLGIATALINNPDESNSALSATLTPEEKHELLGHRSLPGQTSVECEACAIHKAKRQARVKNRTQEYTINGCTPQPGDLWFADVAGPFSPSFSGKTHYIVFVEYRTGWTFTYLAGGHGAVSDAFKAMLQRTPFDLRRPNNNDGIIHRALRTDNHSAWKSFAFRELLASSGFVLKPTPSYTQWKNGRAERTIQTLNFTTETILHNKDRRLWGAALQHACLLQNIIDTKMKVSPFEAVNGKPFDISKLRVFGERAFVHVDKSRRRKGEDRASRGIYIGHQLESGGHIIAILRGEKLTVLDSSHNSNFTSNHQIAQEISTTSTITADLNDEVSISDDVEIEFEDHTDISEDDSSSSSPSSTPNDEVLDEVDLDALTATEHDQNLAAFLKDEGESIAMLITAQTTSSAKVSNSLPKTRQGAIDKEMRKMFAPTAVYDEVDEATLSRLNKSDIINAEMLITDKLDEHGHLIEVKGRLVCKGYGHKKGIHFIRNDAPTASNDVVRLMIGDSIASGLCLRQCDIKGAFLNASLDDDKELIEDVYVKIPPIPGWYEEATVVKLNQALYGLKQAPRMWFKLLRKTLIEDMGFKQSQHDQCVFFKGEGEQSMKLIIYVDDLIYSSATEKVLLDFEKELGSRFELKIFGRPTKMLGFGLHWINDNHVILHQMGYVENVLDRYGMKQTRSGHTTLSPNYDASNTPELLEREKPLNTDDLGLYRSIVGSLLYLTQLTRPDMASAVNRLCSFMSKARPFHLNSAKHLLRYLSTHRRYGIGFRQQELQDETLFMYSDASFHSCKHTGRSHGGLACTVGKTLIHWRSFLEPTVALSTAEAEYIALAESGKYKRYLQNVEDEFSSWFLRCNTATTLYLCDNQAAIAIAQGSSPASKTRHILVRYHFIRELISNEEIELKYCPTDLMVADVLTKILEKGKQGEFRDKYLTTIPELS